MVLALQLQAPWYVSSVHFKEEEEEVKELHIDIDFKKGFEFEPEAKVHDRTKRAWHHLNFFVRGTLPGSPVRRTLPRSPFPKVPRTPLEDALRYGPLEWTFGIGAVWNLRGFAPNHVHPFIIKILFRQLSSEQDFQDDKINRISLELLMRIKG